MAPNSQNLSVAVIMRTKDRPLLLKRALESAIKQSYPDLEVVIVNDGGSPHSVDKVVDAYNPLTKGRSIKVLHNAKSLGMEAASNLGIKSTTTKIIAILDDDDRWHKDYLSEAVSYLRSNNYKGVVTYSTLVTEEIQGDKIKMLEEKPYLPSGPTISLFELFGRNTYPTNAFIFTREAYKEVGGYDESLPVLGDWDFNIRFASLFEIGVLQKPLAFVHQRKSIDGNNFGNTVVAQRGVHEKYAQLIRNKLLREDLASKSLGAGYLMNLFGDPNIGLLADLERMRSENKVHFNHISDRMELLANNQNLKDDQIIALAQENLRVLSENAKKIEFASSTLTGLGHKVYRKIKYRKSN